MGVEVLEAQVRGDPLRQGELLRGDALEGGEGLGVTARGVGALSERIGAIGCEPRPGGTVTN